MMSVARLQRYVIWINRRRSGFPAQGFQGVIKADSSMFFDAVAPEPGPWTPEKKKRLQNAHLDTLEALAWNG
jgi:hypothetical protein